MYLDNKLDWTGTGLSDNVVGEKNVVQNKNNFTPSP